MGIEFLSLWAERIMNGEEPDRVCEAPTELIVDSMENANHLRQPISTTFVPKVIRRLVREKRDLPDTCLG